MKDQTLAYLMKVAINPVSSIFVPLMLCMAFGATAVERWDVNDSDSLNRPLTVHGGPDMSVRESVALTK